jgi:F-type H+-transporting ATPase subunit b
MTYSSVIFIATEKTGGLFDLDGTLPLVALQFLLLMFVLNIILYNPLFTVRSERKNYVEETTNTASNILAKANALLASYDEEVDKVRKLAKTEVALAQKQYKEIADKEAEISQREIDSFLDTTNNNLKAKKQEILASLKGEVETLSGDILVKILN